MDYSVKSIATDGAWTAGGSRDLYRGVDRWCGTHYNLRSINIVIRYVKW